MASVFDDADRLTIGLVVNPIAGSGGPAALKGSDLDTIKNRLHEGEITERAPERVIRFLHGLIGVQNKIRFITARGNMGETYFSELPFEYAVIDTVIPKDTRACHTQDAVKIFLNTPVDLILFVGGDGTARDVYDVVGVSCPVLGIPSGVKMHSSVFALNPEAAAELLIKIVGSGQGAHNQDSEMVNIREQEVRDIDEALLQKGVVKSRYYGDMLVPFDDQFVQAVKQGGGESDELSLIDIGADIRLRVDDIDNLLLIFSPGTTNQFIQDELGFQSTLLGVDVVKNGAVIYADANANQLEEVVFEHDGPIKLVVTPIGGQGYLFGRGNQQLTPGVLRRIKRENVWVVATPRKLQALDNRALLLDTDDFELDKSWSGMIPVITGYQQQVFYRVRR